MPGIIRLSKKELDELIEVTEDADGDATELKRLLAEVIGEGEASETGKPPGMAAGGQRRGDDN